MKQINQSIIKFQSELKPIYKDSVNPFFKSKYADLSSILEIVVPLLTKHGIAVIQPMRVIESGTILMTKLIHESGEELLSEMILPHHNDPQKFGSLITYYKRYQLQAMLGIATSDEDDDANLASDKNTFNKETSKKSIPKIFEGPATEAQKNTLKKLNIQFNDNIQMQEASQMIKDFYANKGK